MMRARILIVDDEDVARESLSDILRLHGYEVNTVANGQLALDFLRREHVDLMIVDLRMPGVNGVEVVRVANQISPDTEVIMLTAYPSVDSAVDALRLRVHDYLQKPATPSQILASVQRGLLRRAQRLEAAGVTAERIDLMEAPSYRFPDGTVVDLSRRLVRPPQGEEISLTPAEGRLLAVFLESPGHVFSHRDLVLMVQGYETSPSEAPEILRPLVSRLRHKLAAAPALTDCIQSVRGTGYVFECEQVEPIL